MAAISPDPFIDIATTLSALGYRQGENDLRGRWALRNRWNIPGPIYVGDDDACGTGPMEAPNNVILVSATDERYLGRDSAGGEFVFRQPTLGYELRQVLRAAEVNAVCAYGIDGNMHWNRREVVHWWQEIKELRETVRRNLDVWIQKRQVANGADTDRPSAELWRWIAYLESDAELYLAQYCYFLEVGSVPSPESALPEL